MARLANEKMNVLGHDDISHYNKFVANSDLVKDFEKPVAVPGRAQDRLAMIAASGDEVEMSGIVFSS